jgi:membrane fusion protein, multidrug efflux system
VHKTIMAKKTTRIISFIGIALLVAVFLAYRAGFFSEKKPDPPAAAAVPASGPAGGQALMVEAVIVQPQRLRDAISVNGSTLPDEEVSITSEIPGIITKISFREGTAVKRGAVLVELDTEELKAERRRLSVQKTLNEKIAERLKALYDKEGVSLQEYEIAVAEAEKTQADIAVIDAQLEKRIIRAPFDGRLGLRLVSEGSYIAPGTPIVSLVSINPIKLEFSVPERYSRDMSLGAVVEFMMDGANRAYTAKVMAKEPNIDPATRTMRIRAEAPNPNGAILPGSFARVSVGLQQFDEALLVPTQAVIPEQNRQKVFVYRNGQAEEVEVSTGIRQEANIQITAGLAPGDTLITTGILQLRAGSAVALSSLKQI